MKFAITIAAICAVSQAGRCGLFEEMSGPCFSDYECRGDRVCTEDCSFPEDFFNAEVHGATIVEE